VIAFIIFSEAVVALVVAFVLMVVVVGVIVVVVTVVMVISLEDVVALPLGVVLEFVLSHLLGTKMTRKRVDHTTSLPLTV